MKTDKPNEEKTVQEILQKAIDVFGGSQCIIAIEEMSELQKEICKFQRGDLNRANLVEEMADVTIMLEQLKIMFEVSDEELLKEMERKLLRLEKRLEALE